MNVSCSQKIYPSGLEGDLFSYQKNFQRKQQKRKAEAKRANRKTARLKRQAMKPLKKKEKEDELQRKKLYAEHFERQDPHVQERMKQNLKETKKKYPSKNTLCKKLVFWEKNKCAHGF
jgi:hypothetical protein